MDELNTSNQESSKDQTHGTKAAEVSLTQSNEDHTESQVNASSLSSLAENLRLLSMFQQLFNSDSQEQSEPQVDEISPINCQMARKRILSEIKKIHQNPPINWRMQTVRNKWNVWNVWITLHTNTPFHSTPFKLMVTFPENYPYQRPIFKLQKPHLFFHPNISTLTGTICQKTIQAKQPTIFARQRIDAIVRLFAIPNPESPYNKSAASLYQKDPKEYYKTAFRIFKGYQKMIN